MTNQLIKQLPTYEQRHATIAVMHARQGNWNAIHAAIRRARTAKVQAIYNKLIQTI